LDEVIDDAVVAAVTSLMDARAATMHARLDKVPGKLGFAA
jgi:hypothetical protein